MPKTFKAFLLLTLCLLTYSQDNSAFTLKSFGSGPIAVEFETKSDIAEIIVDHDSNIGISINNQNIIDYDRETDSLTLPSEVVEVKGNLEANDTKYLQILYDNVNQWKLYTFEDFQGVVSGWNSTAVSSCPPSSNKFLGGNCNFAGINVTNKWSSLPAHRMVKVTFNFHFLDDWNGESGYVLLNDNIYWQNSYSWCDSVLPWYCKKFGINACGNEYPDNMAQAGEFIVPHEKSSLTLTFGSNLNGDPCMASWGIDDVSIYLI